MVEKCRHAHALIGDFDKKCPICRGTNGEVVSDRHIEEGTKSSAYFSVDAFEKPKKKK